ncbi:DUF2029 domain-containing protein [Ktedonosporobacter rubrisoli]|uniref:DUF2029 domain-containing protein n=1 Tax=Ktedonosporobacter rubrisoli TaxID=2509675 RepID=A0A4P6K1B2_KTERU|nr:glycosyltransferase 87 family protein [Ktedonosporobacter rubrisoli]QBD81864.1 DUF2029 domain-containing protein [Ktedonosporobacter rubrisoli]
MAQRSIFVQTPLVEQQQTSIVYRWLRYFFSDDVSRNNRQVIALQQRAVWIGIALILQALNEIDHAWYFPFLMPFGSLIPLALIGGSFICIWMAFRPARTEQRVHNASSYPNRWQRTILTLTLLLTIPGVILFGRSVVMSFMEPQFSNDGTSLDTNAAILLVQGRNPYTDSNIIDLARRFPIQPNWTTPLRVGQFAGRLDYPTMTELQSALDTSFKAGSAPEFEAKVSYPALSFLTLVPFVLLGNYNVLPFYVLSYLALIALAWKITHPQLRPWVLLLGLANIPMWSSAVGGNLDIFYILLIVLVWLLRDRRWTSSLCLGLAIASKQPAWLFAPFYMIMVWRHYGLKEAIYRALIAGSLGLAINLPFIIWNPQAWLAGVLAPVADPMFPMGVGIIGLSITHLLPYLPSWLYTALEGSAMLLALAWYWRICRSCPEAAMLLAVVPLFFAWRSLPSYFYCAAFPLFILMLARLKPSASSMSTAANTDESQSHTNIGLRAWT